MQFKDGSYLVDLHNHLDATLSANVLRQIAGRKRIKLDDNFETEIMNFESLSEFVRRWSLFGHIFAGDSVAIEELTYDILKRETEIGVAYLELRFAPFLLSTQSVFYRNVEGFQPNVHNQAQAIAAVKQAVVKGMNDFGIQVRLILAAVRTFYEFNKEMADLGIREELVVGFDTAGDEIAPMSAEEFDTLNYMYSLAGQHNLGRTCHAGEAGPSDNIRKAVEDFEVSRIGHGYALYTDLELAKKLQTNDIHFELCPISSVRIPKPEFLQNLSTIYRWFFTKYKNYSINSDGSMFFENVNSSIDLCKLKFQMTEEQALHAQLNAASHAFLSKEDKESLIQHIKVHYRK